MASSAPRSLLAVGWAGVALLALPLGGMLVRVPFARLPELLGSAASLDALRLSLMTAALATVASLALGLPIALLLHAGGPGRALLRAIVLVPLVLPPVVSGLALLYTFGRTGAAGRLLAAAGVQIGFTTAAVVIAQTFVSLPFVVLTLEQALDGVGRAGAELARALGAGPWTLLWRITLPAMRGSLLTAGVLALARSLGEFGATLAFAGSMQGVTRTLPLEIYLQREDDVPAALALSLVLMTVALLTVLVAWLVPALTRGRAAAEPGVG
jgi:molybdate transport system permease protein